MGGNVSRIVTAEEIVARVPEWTGREVTVEVLRGGLANRSWVARVDGERYVIKAITEAMGEFNLMIPSATNLRNTSAAGESGVAARVFHSFPDPPALVMEFIDGRTLQTADLSEPEMVVRLGSAVARLHRYAPAFENTIEIWGFLDDYLKLVEEHDLPVFDGLLEALPTLREIQDALTVNALPFVPSHNDLLPLNVMDDGDVRLIDYDFSGMNDPMFDLGDLAMEGDYDWETLRKLCHSYFGEDNPVQCARAALFGMAAQYTWVLLFIGMAHLLPEAPAEDYDYTDDARTRWDWVCPKLADPGLAELIALARQG
jgi:thiamine kinase-like enzyme